MLASNGIPHARRSGEGRGLVSFASSKSLGPAFRRDDDARVPVSTVYG